MMSFETLATANAGQEFVIRAIRASDACHCRRMRELGLLEGRVVRVLANRDPLICQVGQCRLGLCRRLASGVLVEPVDCRPACESGAA
jgi:Fe2+ transport system protein FeoA